MKKLLRQIIKLPVLAVVELIAVYQAVLSPDHSWLKARFPYGYCRHYPSCSEYSRNSFLRFGLFKGFFLSAKRLAKCHPWAQPSVDPVPEV